MTKPKNSPNFVITKNQITKLLSQKKIIIFEEIINSKQSKIEF